VCVCVYLYFLGVIKTVAVYENYVGVVFPICVAELVPSVECPVKDIMLDDGEALYD